MRLEWRDAGSRVVFVGLGLGNNWRRAPLVLEKRVRRLVYLLLKRLDIMRLLAQDLRELH